MRYLTTEPMDSLDVSCFTEQDDCTAAMADAHCWVWQEADSPEQAIAQHMDKFEQWESDMNAGREIKHTY